jgi:hypothetical protein
VLLGVEADHERGNVDDLLADTIVLLAAHLLSNQEQVHTGCGAGGSGHERGG